MAEEFAGAVGDAQRCAAVFSGDLSEESVEQEWDVGESVAQGWDVYGDDVESEVEVFAESAIGDAFFEIFVGGGDDANVDV